MNCFGHTLEIDAADIAFLHRFGARFLVFDDDGRLICSVVDRTTAESVRMVPPDSTLIAEIKYVAGEFVLSFDAESVEFFS